MNLKWQQAIPFEIDATTKRCSLMEEGVTSWVFQAVVVMRQLAELLQCERLEEPL
jgi:hypothetical protein